jgi:Domain of unknown function (DUF4864)
MRTPILIAAFLIAIVLPVRAGDDVAAAENVIRAQAEAFARDDAATAYSYAAPALHEMFPNADIFMSMVRKGYVPVYRHKSFEFGEARALDGKVAVKVRIVDADGIPWDALYTLQQQGDGSFKITGCLLTPIGQSA